MFVNNASSIGQQLVKCMYKSTLAVYCIGDMYYQV